MTPTDYSCFGALWIVPIALAVWWIRMKLGVDKRWFVMPGIYVSRNLYFFLPTFVVGFAVFLIGAFLVALDPYDDNASIFLFSAFGLWFIGFVLAYLEPNWMAPDWYRWLKKEHDDIMPYLVRDAQRLGREAWMERVKTQEGLEEWAAEVRRKHGL